MKPIFILIIGLLVLVLLSACTSQSDSDSVKAQLQATQANLTAAQSELQHYEALYNASQAQVTTLQNEVDTLKQEVDTLNTSLSTQQQGSNNAQSQLDLYKKTFGATVFAGVQPTEACGSGSSTILYSNPSARDTTWQQVKSFVLSDETGVIPYSGDFVCCDFANRIYNDAERIGIRAAFVIIHFSDGSTDHAINAFHTTDLGLVFIDTTGLDQYDRSTALGILDNGMGGPLSENTDKIAYPSAGKQLGFVSLGTDYGPKYENYVQWEQDKDAFETAVSSYEDKVAAYNAKVQAKIPMAANEYYDLENERAELIKEWKPLGVLWDPMGTIRSMEVYW